MTGRKTARLVAVDILVLILLLIFIIPLLETFITSFKPGNEIFRSPIVLFPYHPSFVNYVDVVKRMGNAFFLLFRNSVVITTSSVVLIVVLSSLAAYGLSRIDFFGKSLIIFFVSLIVSIPLIITVIPVFMMETHFHLVNTWLGLILPYTAVYMPVPLFILYATFLKIPTEIEESAYLDGANRLRIFTSLFLPLGRAGLVSAVIISFLNCWGEFLFALVLTSNLKSTTLSIGILLVNYEEQSWSMGIMSAVMILSVAIPLTLYLILQRHFVAGLLAGSIKG